MATRNRIDHDTVSGLTARLHGVLNQTVKFLRCPMTADEMRAIWHTHMPKEIKEAHALLTEYGYLNYRHPGTDPCAIFVIPDMQCEGGQLGIRMYLNREEREEGEFMHLPIGCPHMPLHKFGADRRRWITTSQIKEAVGAERSSAFLEWGHNAALISATHIEAIQTITDIFKLASTVGQIKRMVPEIVQYCGAAQQKALNEQVRRSPLPDEWAVYDKSRVQRLLDALAKGHLVSGIGKVEASGGEFSWAQYGTKDGGASMEGPN